MIYEKMLVEYLRLDEQISKIERKLAEFPEGRLFCVNDGGHYKWYRSEGG